MSLSTNETVSFVLSNFVHVIFGEKLVTVEFPVSCQTAKAETCALGKMAIRKKVVPVEQLVVSVWSYVYVEVKGSHA